MTYTIYSARRTGGGAAGHFAGGTLRSSSFYDSIRLHVQAMENHRDDRCRGVEEDGSDEVWPAAVIPDGLESEIDPGARSLDVCIFAAAVFAPSCALRL